MHPIHTRALTQARAHLAALADQAQTPDASSAYERVLIDLDRLYADQTPGFEPLGTWLAPDFLCNAAAAAIEGLAQFGIDPLQIELLLDELADARSTEST